MNYFRENTMLKSLMAIVVLILIPVICFSEAILCPETSTATSSDPIGPPLPPPSLNLQHVVATAKKQGGRFTVECVYYNPKQSKFYYTTRIITSKLATAPTGPNWSQCGTNCIRTDCYSTKPEDCGIDSSNILPD